MRLLITGGAGFIGSNLIRFLLPKKHQVLNLDRLSFPGSLHTISDLDNLQNYSFQQLDICQSQTLLNIVNEFKPDAIFHLAAESHVDRSIDNPEAFIDSNIKGTFSLLEAFRNYFYSCNEDRRRRLRFIHISTDEVYGSLGDNDAPFREQDSYKPNSPYSASKAAADHLVRAWRHTYSLPVLITNCSNNYGPYQFPEKLIPLTINKALAGEELPVYGDGSNIRDWLFVDDHVRALNVVLEKGEPGETYNIGGNCELTNLNLVKKICDFLDQLQPGKQLYGKQIKFVADRPGHDHRYAIDISKIQSELGWSPGEDFDSNLQKTIIWYIENQQWCKKVCHGGYNGQRLGVKNI